MRTCFQSLILFCLLIACLIFVASTTHAQDQEAPPAPPAIVPLPELQSPRATLKTFLQAMQDKETELAISCLDLGKLTKEATATSGPTVVYQLHVVIQRLASISVNGNSVNDNWAWEKIPDENDYEKRFKLDAIPNALAGAGKLVIRRNKADANWRFSQETCAGVESLYNELEQEPVAAAASNLAEGEAIEQPFTIRLRNTFPVFLRNKTLILPDYQWLCLLSLIFIGLAADVITRGVLSVASSHWLGNYIEEEELAARAKIWRPIGRLVNAAMWYWGTKLIGLPPATLGILLVVLKLFTVYAAVWTAFAIIDVAAKYLAKQALRTDTKFDDLLVPLVSKSLKILATCIGLITTAQTFELPILGLVGGLGLGGAALAFASKDAVANFFGSVTVLFDRPFEVGDWIVTEGAEGTVETVGFRSTRIRTFYNSLVTLPNSHLTTAAVDNMGRRRYRRIKTTLGVQYNTTPDQLEAFCEGIRELIRRNPNTRKDYFHVYFNDFGANSLDIMLYCFVQCPDWGSELNTRHQLLSDIVRLADKLGVQFAFPTRTLHMVDPKNENSPAQLGEPSEAGKKFAEEIALRASSSSSTG